MNAECSIRTSRPLCSFPVVTMQMKGAVVSEQMTEWWCRRCNLTEHEVSIVTAVYCPNGHAMKRVEAERGAA